MQTDTHTGYANTFPVTPHKAPSSCKGHVVCKLRERGRYLKPLDGYVHYSRFEVSIKFTRIVCMWRRRVGTLLLVNTF